MNQDQFVARHQERWQELAGILDQAQKLGPQRLPTATVERLGRLYRWAASDLAYARTYFPGSQASLYLNELVARAHSLVYAEPPQRWKAIRRFLTRGIPQAVREAWRPFVLAGAFMVLGALIGWFAILHDPNLAQALVSDQILNATPEPKSGDVWPVSDRALTGTFIMLNNIRVGILSFALGITLGVGTALVLFQNGLILGALAAKYHQAGLSYPFWALILPHGVVELLAICLCGAAGFAMGWPIVAPGDLTRKKAIAQGARRAAILLLSSIPMFVIAAIIEGWITPEGALPEWSKYLIAVVTGLLTFAYWLLPGRKQASQALPQ
jgi:uncharacterized membrane protein SpoIIM required for sporulation